MNRTVLINTGIDFEGVAGFLGDKELFENILETFLEDDTFHQGKVTLEKNDYYLYKCTHTLKGISGNTNMTRLFQSSGVLCNYFKKRDYKDKDTVISLFCEMEEAYHSVLAGIIAAKEV